ncbi:MAG: DUF4833 domain-containing protein [Xenococcaceae cyanobacterium]
MVKYSRIHTLSWLTTLVVLFAISPSSAQNKSINSVFYISKSENRNQVHYNVNVNSSDCSPISSNPVNALWHMLEEGENKTEQLIDREQPFYGIGSQEVSGNKVTFFIRALEKKDKPIELITSGSNGRCEAKAYTQINGKMRQLSSVYVKLKWFNTSVDHLKLYASDRTTEIIRP